MLKKIVCLISPHSFFSRFSLLFFTPFIIFAQAKREDTKKSFIPEQTQSLIQEKINLRKQAQKALLDLEVVEEWVDPSTYEIGVGDIIGINIIGGNNLYLELQVTPEGIINIPGYSSILVKGKTLEETKKIIQAEVGQNSYISLVNIRPIKVYVTGEIDFPGAYIARPTERVFSVLDRAGNFKDLALLERISIYRGNDTILINGYDFLKRGNLQANPYVKDGDVIHIPKADAFASAVVLEGGVKRAGLFPIVENENLYDFLVNKADFGEKVEFSVIRILRFENNKQKTININLREAGSINKIKSFILKSGDIIEVDILGDVYVQGEVTNPGVYPFVAGFKVGDYIGLAGGDKPTADMDNLKIISANGVRKATVKDDVERGESIIVPKSLKAKVIGDQSLLQILSSLIQILLTIQLLRMS